MITVLHFFLLAAAPIASTGVAPIAYPRVARAQAPAQVSAQVTIVRAAVIRQTIQKDARRETDREYHHRKSALMVEFY